MSGDRPRLRVLKLSSYLPDIGGGELQTHAVGRALRRVGVRVRVIDTRGAGGVPRAVRIDGIPVVRFSTPGWRGVDALVLHGRILALLGRLLPRVDLVQVNHLGPALLPALLRGSARRLPVILVPWGSCRRGVGPFRRGPLRALIRSAARRVTRVIALSHGMADNLVTLWGFDRARIEVIPNGVDIGRYRPRPGSPRPAGLPAAGPLVLAVGRLTPAKRYDLLLEAWREVQRAVPEARLVILGDGELREDLRRRTEGLGLSASVSFPGRRQDVEQCLAAADLYVSSSETEGMSNALLEALASGLPAVATRISGSEDLVVDGDNGLLVAPGDPTSLAAALVRLLGDDGMRRRLGEAARRRIESGYSLEAIAGRYRATYERLLGERRSRG